ncbi:hypothetical protein SUGI_0543360 [Cryptomeria japonica]|nr:hypothetical protein SUGI_0543360 [Cryptomeria japonica]
MVVLISCNWENICEKTPNWFHNPRWVQGNNPQSEHLLFPSFFKKREIPSEIVKAIRDALMALATKIVVNDQNQANKSKQGR